MKKNIFILLFVFLLPAIVNAKTVDEIYSEYFPNGEYTSNSIVPENIMEAEYIFTYQSSKFALEEDNTIFITCDNDDRTDCLVCITGDDGYEELPLKVKYNNPDENVLKAFNKIKDSFPEREEFDQIYYNLEDLEFINYLYNGGYNDIDESELYNVRLNYTIELKELLKNTNFEAVSDIRAGAMMPFKDYSFGGLSLIYDGFIYGTIDRIGTNLLRVIYVPDNTDDTSEAYIKAALERINNYTKDESAFSIEKYEFEDELEKEMEFDSISDDVDLSKTLNECYTLKMGNYKVNILIVKDSSKMQKNPVITTTDARYNSSISVDVSNVPIDSKIKIKKINPNTEDYKNLINLLEVDDAYIYDIDLFSNLKKGYIKHLDNGKFKVFIPVPEEYKDKKLIIYYVNDSGTKEEYNVSVEDGYAIFETNHFSTYSLTTVNEEVNPATADNLNNYLIIGIVSLLGIGIYLFTTKKVN